MAEAIAEETQLNHHRLIANAKDNKEQARKDPKKHCKQVEYDPRQRDQHHKMEMAQHQAILNQGDVVIRQRKPKILQLQMTLQCLKGYLSKCSNNLDLEEDSDE